MRIPPRPAAPFAPALFAAAALLAPLALAGCGGGVEDGVVEPSDDTEFEAQMAEEEAARS